MSDNIYAPLPEPQSECVHSDSHEFRTYTEPQLLAFADATHALRAEAVPAKEVQAFVFHTPQTATAAMLAAGRDAWREYDVWAWDVLLQRVYRAMCMVAAPQPAPPPQPQPIELGWLMEAATKGELDAYEQGSAECQAAVRKILDGKDNGAGVSVEPWESLRARLMAMREAAAQPQPSAEREALHKFLNAAAGEGLELDGVDAGDLYVALFPAEYAAATGDLLKFNSAAKGGSDG